MCLAIGIADGLANAGGGFLVSPFRATLFVQRIQGIMLPHDPDLPQIDNVWSEQASESLFP
jgi:hypothetical protein